MCYVIARINDNLFESEIAEGIDIVQGITWVADTCEEVSIKTIKNCSAKCIIVLLSKQDDEEFNAFFNKLAYSECDMTVGKYVNLDVQACSSLPGISSDVADQGGVSSVKACVTEYIRKECGDLNEVAADNDDKKDDDDDTNSKDVEVVEIGTGEALTMLDRLVNLKDLSKEETNSLAFLTDKLEKIRVLNKKQSHINDYSSFYDRFYQLIFNTSG